MDEGVIEVPSPMSPGDTYSTCDRPIGVRVGLAHVQIPIPCSPFNLGVTACCVCFGPFHVRVKYSSPRGSTSLGISESGLSYCAQRMVTRKTHPVLRRSSAK